MGMQAGGSGVGAFSLLVHATHAVSEAGGSTEQLVLSNCVIQPVWRVMLWYSNPYHFLTGFVEASISSGYPSQTDKYGGGEHPMWLVTGHSPFVAGRFGMGSGFIDRFFDKWLPHFAYEVR